MSGVNIQGQQVLWFLALFSYMKERDLHQMVPKGWTNSKAWKRKIAEFKVSFSRIFFKWELAVFSQKKGRIQNDEEEGQGLLIMFFPDSHHLPS